ncbi:MAG: hypothetical protein ACYC3X_20635 [Pirellulaceae bacterium]
MWRLSLDTIGIGILLVMLLTLMFAVLISQRQRNQKTIGIWMGSVLIGLLLGSALTLGALRLGGYRPPQGNAMSVPGGGPAASASAPSGGMGGGMMGGGMGGGMMGGGMGGGMMGGGMGGGMMGGGMGGPSPKRDLTTLVRKLELLTGKIGITLTAEQSASVNTALADIETAEKMSDEVAKSKLDTLMALLDNDQKSALDAIGLPRPQRGAGGPGGPGAGGPGAGGPGGPGAGGPGAGGPGGPGAGGPGAGGPGGSPPAADANPFQQDTNVEALKSLRQRFVPVAPVVPADQPAPVVPADQPAPTAPVDQAPPTDQAAPAEAAAPAAPAEPAGETKPSSE